MDDIDKWEREHARYFLREGGGAWKEVTESEFIQAERRAGFFPKPECGPVATSGFGNSLLKLEGRVDYEGTPKDTLGVSDAGN